MTCSATTSDTLGRIRGHVDAFDSLDISRASGTQVSDLLGRVTGMQSWRSAAQALLITRADVLAKSAPRPLLAKMILRERYEFIQLANSSSLHEIAAVQTVEEFTTTLQALLAGMREETPDQRLVRQRLLSFLNIWDNKDGMTVINGELDPEMGNRFRELIETDLKTLWAANSDKAFPIPDGVCNKHGWLRAQALLLRLTGTTGGTTPTSSKTAAGTGRPAPAGAPQPTNNPNNPDNAGDDGPGLAPTAPAIGVTLGPPAELVLFADFHKLTSQLAAVAGEPVGWFGDGTPVGVATIRRLACDAHVLPMIFKPDGEPLDNARRSRTANRTQRRALQKMYNGCMFCGTPFNWCQVHHFWHWLDLGPSQLWNLGPLCTTHHHQIHHNGHQIIRNPDHTLNLQTASGYIIATTTVPHPQPPVELGISRNFQLPHGHNPDQPIRIDTENSDPDLTETVAWNTQPPPSDQPPTPAHDPNPTLF